MKKEVLFVFLGIFVLAVSITVLAKPNVPEFSIPEHAVQVSEGVFSLGHARDVDGRIVEGFAFIDYRKGFDHKPNHNPGGRGGNGGGGSKCYAFLARGAKWKTNEPYIVDPSNTAGLNEGFVRSNLAEDIHEWEAAAGVNILGNEVAGSVDKTNIGNLNGKNEVIFADIGSSGAIAVTIVWGIFSGPPRGRELVEWDQVYDDADFAWSSSGASEAMDFENIAQHELGHSVGMGHPENTCTEETMYAFASAGETKKRTLNDGDIAGINNLY